jgi:hypothetical protein
MNNYFEAEQNIIDRLTTITELKKVAGWTELDTALDSPSATPAALVVYLGDVAEAAGRQVMVTQKWGVMLVIRGNRIKSEDGDATRNLAGSLIPKIIEALNNQIVAEQATPLKAEGGVQVAYYPGTTASFTLTFTTRKAVV